MMSSGVGVSLTDMFWDGVERAVYGGTDHSGDQQATQSYPLTCCLPGGRERGRKRGVGKEHSMDDSLYLSCK